MKNCLILDLLKYIIYKPSRLFINNEKLINALTSNYQITIINVDCYLLTIWINLQIAAKVRNF